MKRTKLLLAFCLFMCLVHHSKAQTFPPGFSVSPIASGWNQPVGAVATSNGQRLFVWEKDGRVYVCNWSSATQQYVKQSTPVLDISQEVGGWRDFGLLGFALDPGFNSNGLIYLLYVVDRHYLMNFGTPSYSATTNDYYKPTIGRVTRYKTNNVAGTITADPATRFILLGETRQTGLPILHESHGVGSLAFAADGTLLVTHGDGACYNHTDVGSDAIDTYYQQALTDGIIRPEENVGALRSQMINSHNGKLLRIDPQTGNGLSNNPFYDPANPRAPRSRVWAMGLRNPFRMSIKPNSGSTNPETGDLGEIFIGDVGWGTWEELNVVDRPGLNLGWPLFEGHTVLSSYTSPNVENKDELNPLFGINGCTRQYFYFKELLKQATADNITTVYNPCNSSVAIGTHNRYFHRRPAIDWRHGSDNARIGIFSGNNASTALLGSPASGVAGTPFRGNCSVGGAWYSGTAFPPAYRNAFFFGEYDYGNSGPEWIRMAKMKTADGLESVDLFGNNLSYPVFIGENPLNGGELICIEYINGGVNAVIRRIAYGGSQPPVAKVNADKIFGPSDLSVTFNSNGSSDPEGGVLTYLWDFGDNTTSTAANPPVHIFTAPANTPKKFVVKLTVRDNMNLPSTDSIIISVNNTPPVVNIISPVKNSRYRVDQPVPDTAYTLKADVTDEEHPDGELKYEWQTFLRHNEHEHAESIDTNRITTSMISRIGCNGDTYYFMIKLKVTDAAGLSAEDSSKIYPRCPGDIILPVTFSSFSVNNIEDVNLVKWITESQENNKYFELERSTDGRNFETINKQNGTNGAGTQQYSFADETFTPGINYYRLKMIEIDGVYSYSRIIKVMNGSRSSGDLHITPNPVVKEFTLSAYFPERGPVMIRIIDVSGKVVKQISDSVDKGYITMQVYQLDKLKQGTYFVEIKQKDYTRRTKIVKID